MDFGQIVSGSVRIGAEAVRVSREALWNSDVSAAPYALLECRSLEDVRRAVRSAAEQDRTVSVIGGGHDWAGRAVADGAVVLDLHGMTDVQIDQKGAAVTIGGGTTTRDLLAALPADLAVVTSAWSSTGLVGVATGGGYGKLNRRFGLAADNIRRAEVVLADGSIVIASETEDTELLWALRGGGCNFGVVTSMTFAVHRLPKVLTAGVFVPLAKAKAALLSVQDMLDAPDDGMSLHTIIGALPSVGKGLLLSPLWIGEEAEGERRVERIAKLEGAHRLTQGWSAYRETISEKDEAAWPKQGDYRMYAHNAPRFDESVVDVLVDAAHRFGSDQDAFIIHDLFGAATRVPRDATAFALREPHINVQVLAGRHPAHDGDGRRRARWLDDVKKAFSPWRALGGYANLLGPSDVQEARMFYGDALPRLRRAKASYDPQNRFPSNRGWLG